MMILEQQSYVFILHDDAVIHTSIVVIFLGD